MFIIGKQALFNFLPDDSKPVPHGIGLQFIVSILPQLAAHIAGVAKVGGTIVSGQETLPGIGHYILETAFPGIHHHLEKRFLLVLIYLDCFAVFFQDGFVAGYVSLGCFGGLLAGKISGNGGSAFRLLCGFAVDAKDIGNLGRNGGYGFVHKGGAFSYAHHFQVHKHPDFVEEGFVNGKIGLPVIVLAAGGAQDQNHHSNIVLEGVVETHFIHKGFRFFPGDGTVRINEPGWSYERETSVIVG